MPTVNEVIVSNSDDGYAEYEDYYSSGASCQGVATGGTKVRFEGRSMAALENMATLFKISNNRHSARGVNIISKNTTCLRLSNKW